MTLPTENAGRAAARGRFITFEGGEGAGKSTQIAHLAQRLAGAGVKVLSTREPGGTPFAEQARIVMLDSATAPQSSLAQALLFNAARADHLARLILPALEDTTWVLCDRFADSTRAYQGAAGGVDPVVLATLEKLVVAAAQPDLTILLDIDPKIGLTRANQRRSAAATPGTFIAADTFEGRQLEFHQKLRAGFLAIAKAEPHRVLVVDAFSNELAIADQIWRHVCDRFKIGQQ